MKKMLIGLACVGMLATAMNAAAGLIISQYYEGASNDKWIEIYNPGPGSVDLAAGDYRLGLWSNAAREAWKTNGTPSYTAALTGTIAEGGTFLYAHTNAVNPSYATWDMGGTVAYFNGDDTPVLYTGATYDFANVVDVIGLTNTTTSFGADKSFVRTNTVTTGVNTDFNPAEWIQVAYLDVDAALVGTNERLGYHSTGAAAFGVFFDKAEGFEVVEGSSDAITATAANGTEPYGYSWGSTLGGTYYVASGNVFTILATAPTGDYSATVTATDDAAQTASNTVSFSVVPPAVLYGITINPTTNGTVTTEPADEAEEGQTVTITATGAPGYIVDTISVVDEDLTPIGSTTTFVMPAGSVTISVTFQEAPAGRIVISQYTETDSGTIPKGIEIWNVSGTAITFDATDNLLDVKVAANGTNVASSQVTASSGTLAAGAVWVIGTTNMNPDLVEPFTFNGDDALVLELGGIVQDVIGTVGVDPGTSWTNAGVSTANQNIQLKAGITTGDVDGWSDPSERFEYVAAGSDLTGFGVAPGGATFGVTFDQPSGLEVEEGTTDVIVATAANGTEPYGYSWSSTLGGAYYAASNNEFTILATAPIGNYSAEVIATDSSDPVQSVTNSLNFSVVAPAVKYAIAIVTNDPAYGTATTDPATEAEEGAIVTVTATPAGGYVLESIVVNGGAVTVTGNTFTMPAEAATVTVTFAESVAEGIVDFRFNADPYLQATAKDANLTVSDMALSAGTIETGITTGTYFTDEPYIEETAGWAVDNQAGAKAFVFTITPAEGAAMTINGISFKAYATSAGPSAFGFDIGDGMATYEVNAPSALLLAVSQAVVGVESQTGAIVVKIQGWANGSRATTGSGTFRLDDVVIHGSVSTGPLEFSVSFNKSSGFEVEEGSSDAVTATAAHGTEPYGYAWSSTLGGAYYTASNNVFTILATAPIGDYSAEVIATDSSDPVQSVTNSLNFSVVAPPTYYAITVAPTTNGTATTTPETQAIAGATVTVNASPAGGYVVESIVVNGGAVTVTGNTFTMPAEAVVVAVTFVEGSASGELIISQYYEGSGSYNKWVEIYNPGASAVDLGAGGYRLGSWNNTNRETWKTDGVPTLAVALSNTIAAGGTYVIGPASASNPVYAVADQNANWAFNGDDSVVLYTGETYAYANVVDAFGLTNTTTTFGQDKSFVRASTVTAGVNTDFNAADWVEYTLTEVEDAAELTNERLGYHSTGAPAFGVTVNKSNGFTVDEGQSDAITATAANGTAPYAYGWTSTLGGAYYVASNNVFTILATAPTGSYSATVTATDATLATASNTVTFSVVGLAPGQPAVRITGSLSGTVGVEMALSITVTNETANDWYIDLKDPDGLDDYSYNFNTPPAFTLTPTKEGTYTLTVTAVTGSGDYSNSVQLAVGGGGANPSIATIALVAGTGFSFAVPDGYTLNRVEGATVLSGSGWVWSTLTDPTDYTLVGTTVTIKSTVGTKRMIRIWLD